MVSLAERRAAIGWARSAYRVSERRACLTLVIERTPCAIGRAAVSNKRGLVGVGPDTS